MNRPSDHLDKGPADVLEKLQLLVNFLRDQSAFDGDLQDWAAEAITRYIDGSANVKTLDHAFGLKSSKRGRKAGLLEEGQHEAWVVEAFFDVLAATPIGKNWPNTRVLAKISRDYPLRKTIQSADDETDGALASELKKILERYRPLVIARLAKRISPDDGKARFPTE